MGDFLGCEFGCPVGWFGYPVGWSGCPVGWFGFMSCGWSCYSQSGLMMVFRVFKYGWQWGLGLGLSYFGPAGFVRYLRV